MARQPKRQAVNQNKASLLITIVLALLLIVGVFILLSYLPDDPQQAPSDNQAASSAKLELLFTRENVSGQNIYPLADVFMTVSAQRIACLNRTGSERFSVDIDFTEPVVNTRDGFFLVTDRDSGSYVMLTAAGESYRGQMSGRIEGTAIGSDGMVALVQAEDNSKGVVSILAKESGSHLFDCHFPESGYVLSVSFTPDNLFFDVALINTDTVRGQMLLKRFDVSGTARGQIIPQTGDLLPLLFHLPDGVPLLAGAESVLACPFEDAQIAWEQKFAQIAWAADEGDLLYLLVADKKNGPLSLLALDAAGQGRTIAEEFSQVDDLAVLNHLLAVARGAQVVIIDTQKERVVQEFSLESDVLRLAFAQNDRLTVVATAGVWQIDLS